MSKAIRIHQIGGPEAMQWEDVEVGAPGPGEIRIRHEAVGLNYIDVYFRTGLYPAPSLPFSPGMEGAGVVDAVGEGVDSLSVGDRVAYASPPVGAYAEERLMPAEKVVRIPPGVDSTQAAAMMLQGMTVEYLLRRTCPVQSGDTILFHAAAGGVGLIACQWAKHLGATVIGTVGNDEKAELAHAHGCDHPIVYTRENFAERVRELTDGVGVPVVYDAVGRDTFEGSLDCLRPRGMLVSFGQSSGKIDPFDVGILSAKGIPLHHTTDTDDVYRKPERSGGIGAGSVRRGRRRGGAHHSESDVSPRRCGGRAPGARIAANDGIDRPHAVAAGERRSRVKAYHRICFRPSGRARHCDERRATRTDERRSRLPDRNPGGCFTHLRPYHSSTARTASRRGGQCVSPVSNCRHHRRRAGAVSGAEAGIRGALCRSRRGRSVGGPLRAGAAASAVLRNARQRA